MRVNVHVWLSLVHAAERGRAGVISLVGHKAVLRIEREPALAAQIRRRAPGLLDRGNAGQTGSGTGARAGVLIDTGWGLDGGGKAQRGELVAG